MNNSRIPRTNNAKFSGYYFDMNLNIWGDFHIWINVPLSFYENQFITELNTNNKIKAGYFHSGYNL